MAFSACNTLLIQQDYPYKGVLTITLNKPEVHNAFDEVMIAELISVLHHTAKQSDIRIVCLQGQGKSFCAGADLRWMKRMSTFSRNENLADANKLSELMHSLATLPQPTIAIVQGNIFGGGVGLVACCDIVIASDTARFCLSEVKLGLIPAVISPYVIAALGMRAAKHYMLTAQTLLPEKAQVLGLVHQIVEERSLETIRDEMLKQIMQNSPEALRAVKECCKEVSMLTDAHLLRERLAKRIAEIRVSKEAQEGMHAFFEKRSPKWNENV